MRPHEQDRRGPEEYYGNNRIDPDANAGRSIFVVEAGMAVKEDVTYRRRWLIVDTMIRDGSGALSPKTANRYARHE